MDKGNCTLEEPSSPGWGASFFVQAAEDSPGAVVTPPSPSPRPSVVFSSKADTGSHLQKLQNQVFRVLKGLSPPSEEKSRTYNPEVLTSQKRQWASFQLQALHQRILKEPSRLFESMVVVGLPPNCDIQALQRQYFGRRSENSGRLRSALSGQHQFRVEPNLEPQVLFVYPPDKQLPLRSKDLLSFCFPGGLEVHTIERTPSMSELNEILLGQEHLKQNDLSFVFRLQGGGVGVVLLVITAPPPECLGSISLYPDENDQLDLFLFDEMVQQPSRLISMMTDGQVFCPPVSRHILTTRRCYCILSRLPFFELHFGVLNRQFEQKMLSCRSFLSAALLHPTSLSEMSTRPGDSWMKPLLELEQLSGTDATLWGCSSFFLALIIFTEERLERLTKSISELDMEPSVAYDDEVYLEEKVVGILAEHGAQEMLNGNTETVQLSRSNSINERVIEDRSNENHHVLKVDSLPLDKGVNDVIPVRPEMGMDSSKKESVAAEMFNTSDSPVGDMVFNKQPTPKHIPNAILPLLRYQQYDSSDSSSSFQGSPSEDRNFRSDLDSAETDEASFSGQEDNEHNEIFDWAKTNNHGSLQIICEYNRLCVPARGSTIKFHPLEHLHALEFHRPDETVLHMAGSTIDLMSCSTSFELAEAAKPYLDHTNNALRHPNRVVEVVLTIFAGALLEKQIVFVCSNLGILSASVLSIIPLIRPYQWQSFFMPVLPNDMLDFLDAPVPFIVSCKCAVAPSSVICVSFPYIFLLYVDQVGVKSKTAEVQSKSANIILVDANKNQVKSSSIPHFPQYKELYAALTPYHAQLVGESYLGRRRPIYECTDVQVEAAKGFLKVLRSYLDSLCSNLRSHTITNVQSNDDKVSLLLKESFIESFPSRDRPFMKVHYFLWTHNSSLYIQIWCYLFSKRISSCSKLDRCNV
ncbi:DENN domain-containing protein [Cynara cardunculus var. scolymus]|uniref:DENN domain-containing protein n=1 Tax=Cynara cardunculus var. scolymus TaxID=59895 RepID=A0A103XNL7_CYNCS|nr:DENN domain-containing protein [Cynara cardunculus var. scolymus]